MVIFCVKTTSGELVSGIARLPRPGHQPELLLSPGLVAAGPSWAHQVKVTDSAVEIVLLDGGTPHAVPVQPGAQVQLIDRDGVVFTDGGRTQLLSTTGRLSAWSETATSGGRMEWRGPFNGFQLVLDEGSLYLGLPRVDWSQTAIMDEIDTLLGAWWVRKKDLPAWQQEALLSHFRQVDVFAPEPKRALVDGDLGEWRSSEAVVINDVSQVIGDRQSWSSERDASFSVAFRVSGREAWMAVRIRDDDFLPGQDHLRIRMCGEPLIITVPQQDSPPQTGDGWEAVGVWGGRATMVMEIGLQCAVSASPGSRSLIVDYIDIDQGEAPSGLSSAPWPEMLDVATRSRPR
jgi:hypothetical protein